MHIVLGVSGHVGSVVAEQLLAKGERIKVVVRDEQKGAKWKKQGAQVAVADLNDQETLRAALKDGDRLFLIVPPADFAGDVLRDEEQVLKSYGYALIDSGIKKVVGLSSYGAQYDKGTGALLTSYRLEHLLDDLPLKKSFVRPAYYFSNWEMSLESAKTEGVVHTFFPPELQIPMVSPHDVGELIAKAMLEPMDTEEIYNIEASKRYSSIDVANAFSEALGKKVEAVETKPEAWIQALHALNFSKSSAKAFAEMTQSVIDGHTVPEASENVIKAKTTLEEYIQSVVKS